MYKANKKEQFNLAYITAIAAHAGANHSLVAVDEDSVDIQLMGKDYKGKVRNPQIHLQLKCTSQDCIQNDVIKFPLKLKNYNDLRGNNVICPKYLVVLLVPSNESDWIVYDNDYMSLYNNCFWVSIKDHPDTDNTASVTIDVPLSQRFTTAALTHLLEEASNG